jgi:hypothetical protein
MTAQTQEQTHNSKVSCESYTDKGQLDLLFFPIFLNRMQLTIFNTTETASMLLSQYINELWKT